MLQSKHNSQEVLDAGHPPVANKRVCVDFDGTIYPFGLLMTPAAPIKGAAQAVQELKDMGYTIIIFTSRLSRAWHEHEGWDHEEAMKEQIEYITAALDRDGIPYDFITAEKVPAEAYFDDKAYRAAGDLGLMRAVSLFINAENSKVM